MKLKLFKIKLKNSIFNYLIEKENRSLNGNLFLMEIQYSDAQPI